MLKLFIEDYKTGYIDVYTHVESVTIKKIDGKNHLVIIINKTYEKEFAFGEQIPLSEIKLAYLINADTLEEYFRYEK